jgi:SAM-dependent methyltransferase
MRTTTTSKHRELHRQLLRELGHKLEPGARVLDYGCGAGNMVAEYCAAGYDAFGCDIRLDSESERLRPLASSAGSIPFSDASFDFVYSDQVMEHVQDHNRAFAEIKRVMKPGAVSLHIFPAKLKPIENHVFVPFGGVLQSRGWLSFWASLGIRNSFQQGKSAREVVELNSEYLTKRTNYLSRAEILKALAPHFGAPVFAEKYMLKHSYGSARRIYPLAKALPFVAKLYSSFYSRVVFFQKAAN